MDILVFNAGSSSLKFQFFTHKDSGELHSITRGTITAFGARAQCRWHDQHGEQSATVTLADSAIAARWVLDKFAAAPADLVAHRIVHGANEFSTPCRIDVTTLATIERLSTLAPLHNPAAAAVIRACQQHFDVDVPQVAVFDTAFFRALPEHARRYAIPETWYRDYGIQRYGFHGIAHQYLATRTTQHGGPTARMITLQLGQGCSITALRDGVPVETSMGFTPLEGLVMGTRSGDLDPGAVLHLIEQQDFSAHDVAHALQHESGLRGLSGLSGDMHEVLEQSAQGHIAARRAVDIFVHRARKYLGAYIAVLGGVDAIAFGGGIGEHAAEIRARICADMAWCGIRLDASANAAGDALISATNSTVRVYVIAVDEERIIAQHAAALMPSH